MKITNINQVLPAIADKPEFIVMDKGDYTVIDYVYQCDTTFDNPVAMECRGIKFDRDGLILARPFRKFFNYGEQGSGLPLHRPHIITHKLDGSMIHPALIDRKLYYMTRKGHTDVAQKAERHILSSSMKYNALSIDAIRQGWTPVFEYIGPDNRIVLRYDEPMLVLLAMRETVRGQFIPFSGLNRWGREYGIPVVSCRDIGSACTAEEFVKYTRELKGEEGFVVYFDDGYMVKVKAEDYVLKHRALDDLGSKKKVVALCCQGFADDVLPILGDADKEELIAFDRALKAEISRLVHIAHGLVYPVVQGVISRKDFALSPVQNVRPSWLRGVCFGILDGKNAQRLVLQAVEKGGYADIGVKWRGE